MNRYKKQKLTENEPARETPSSMFKRTNTKCKQKKLPCLKLPKGDSSKI